MPGNYSLEVEYGTKTAELVVNGSRAGIRLPVGRLAGDGIDRVFRSATPLGPSHGFELFEDRDVRIGYGIEPVGTDIESASHRLYDRLIRAAGESPLCRIWNYVPGINALHAGLENYRAFSAGRAQAFEDAFGQDYRRTLPSASAVGCGGDIVAAAFVSSSSAPRHFENPEQVPAYHYPSEHGPKPPSFSRATATSYNGEPLVFISGTAAIKGHQTIAPETLEPQVACTLDNLRLIFAAAGVGGLEGRPGLERHFRVYLRHASDLPEAQRLLGESLFRPGDHVVWLRADLCRSSLTVEVEATLLGRPPGA